MELQDESENPTPCLLFFLLRHRPAAEWGKRMTMPHIGNLIKEELDRQERTPTWLARKINCERPNVYYIFRQQSINTDLLLQISRALNVDFFRYYSDEYHDGR